MSSVRRPLLTATAAGTLLCGLWFVPTANATGEHEARQETSAARASTTDTVTADRTTRTTAQTAAYQSGPSDLRLADTGSFDTTPYVVGGTTFLAVGAGFVALSRRRAY